MKKIVSCSMLAISLSFSSFSWSQDIVGRLLGDPGSGDPNLVQPSNPVGGLRGVVREQIENSIQPNPSGGQDSSPNVQAQGGLQLLGVLRANLDDHAEVGQDGTVRFRNDVNPQLLDMGILPNDQLIDANGQSIRDLNDANSFLQGNQNLRVKRNGQIVTLQSSMPQSRPSTNQLGWSFGQKYNGVYITSLVSSAIAAQAGLRSGDQIVSINGKTVGRAEDISTYMLQANNSPTTIVYLRNGQSGEAILNPSGQDIDPRSATQSIQSKLDQIDRLLGEIRAELSFSR